MLPKKVLNKIKSICQMGLLCCLEPCSISYLLFWAILDLQTKDMGLALKGPLFHRFFIEGYHHIIHIDIIKFIHYLHNTKTNQRKTRVKSKRDGTNRNRSIVSKIRADSHIGNNQAYKPGLEKGTHQLRFQ